MTAKYGMFNRDKTVRLRKSKERLANVCLRGHLRDYPGNVYVDRKGHKHCYPCKRLRDQLKHQKPGRASGAMNYAANRRAAASTITTTRSITIMVNDKSFTIKETQPAEEVWRPSTFSPVPNTTPGRGNGIFRKDRGAPLPPIDRDEERYGALVKKPGAVKDVVAPLFDGGNGDQ